MPETPRGAVPTIGGPGERLGSSEMKKVGDVEIQPVVNEGSFLLPTWDRGFWLMPPGGLTRFLIPAPGFVNPEEAFAADSAILESG